VTSFAVIAELPVMDIVAPVTTDAAHALVCHIFHGFGVTTMAMHLGMGLPEFEICVVVVEKPD